MEDAWLVWFVAVSGRLGNLLLTCGRVGAVAGALMSVIGTTDIGLDELRMKLAIRVFWVSLTALFVGALLPDPSDILKAYALIEGGKIVNADNAEAAAKAVAKRIDKLIEALN